MPLRRAAGSRPWEAVPLGKLVRRIRRPVKVHPDRTYREIGIRSHAKGIFHKGEVTGASLGQKAVFWVEPDCFIVNIVFAWEQAIARTTDAEEGMIASHRFPMYKPKQGVLDLDFLTYFFKTPYGKHLLGLASPGGAGRNKTLGQHEFMKLRIPLPPLPEQRKIAEVLGTWDKTIELTERLIEAKCRRKKGLMQRLLTGRQRFEGFATVHDRELTTLGEIPPDWDLVDIQHVACVNTEQLSEDTDPDASYLYLELSSVVQGRMTIPSSPRRFETLPSRARRVLHRGDVIMATVRPNLQGFALCDFEPKNTICSTGFAVISPVDLGDSAFIYQSLYCNMALRQIYGRVTGSNYPALNASDVESLKLTWPERSDERRRIADILTACDAETSLLRQRLELLQEQKKGLMQQLLTGKVRVHS